MATGGPVVRSGVGATVVVSADLKDREASALASYRQIRQRKAELGEPDEVMEREAIQQERGAVVTLDPTRPRRPRRGGQSDASADSGGWDSELLLNRDGAPKRALANVVTVLTQHPGWEGALRFNDFANTVETVKSPPWHTERVEPGEWTERDDVRLVMWLERELGPSFGAALVRSAVENVARRNTYHPVRERLRSLKWDGIDRLDTWLSTYLGAAQQPAAYLASVGRWWMISAVARVEQPGCQADHLLSLEGHQGAGKSTAVRILGEPWTSTLTAVLGDKDAYQVLRGKWIIELAELAGVRRSDAERVKAFVSSPMDTYRPSYGRASADFQRQCVFIASTNAQQYLTDPTGARRFWPVKCGAIDIPALRRNNDQLWAEAVSRYDDGEPWWPSPGDQAQLTDQQEERTEVDPWESPIAAWLARPNVVETNMDELLGDAIGKPKHEWNRSDETRVGVIMAGLKWVRYRTMRKGKRGYVYVPDTDAKPAGGQL